MDMWKPYINAVKEHYSEDIIVFDKYHIVAACNKMLDKLRTASDRDAEKADKKVYKGVRYLLLEGSEKIIEKKSRAKLDKLLQLNEPLSVEGINYKIKTMKRPVYGFRDMEYFKLRIYFINQTRYSLVG